MAFTTSPPHYQGNNTQSTEMLAANAGTAFDIFTAGANGSDVFDVLVSCDDTSAQTASLIIHNGTSGYKVATLTIPITAGTAVNVAAVNMMTSLPIYQDEYGNKRIALKSGEKLQLLVAAATTGKKFWTRAQGRDY